MRRLTAFTYVWRNYLYANQEGLFNDPDDFLTRMSLIQDSKEEILNQALSSKPDQDIIYAAKEEIAFQLDSMEGMIQEFSQYADKYHLEQSPEKLQEYFKEDVVKNDNLYAVASEWYEYAENAKEVIQGMAASYVDAEQWNYLMESMMELQNIEGRNSIQSVRNELKANETETEITG